MTAKDSQFSDEAHKVAKLAIDLWNSNPKIKEGEGAIPGPVSVMAAIRLLSFCETELRIHSASSSQGKLENGRTPFEKLLEEDKQENLPKGKIRVLGRITKKKALESKIRDVFPSPKVFDKIDDFLRYQDADIGLDFRSMSSKDIARRALERCDELSKEPYTLDSLSLYVQRCRDGFVPSEIKRYPFAGEPNGEMYGLFRSSEDICSSGWFAEWEKVVIYKACHKSKSPQEKK